LRDERVRPAAGGEAASVVLDRLGAQQIGVLIRQLRSEVIILVAGQRHLERRENGTSVLAGVLGRASPAFGIRNPPVKLGQVEPLARSLCRQRLGKRRRKLGGHIRGLAPGQAGAQHGQRGPNGTLGMAVIDPCALGDGRNDLVFLHGKGYPLWGFHKSA
jgi:hypothetical protein